MGFLEVAIKCPSINTHLHADNLHALNNKMKQGSGKWLRGANHCITSLRLGV